MLRPLSFEAPIRKIKRILDGLKSLNELREIFFETTIMKKKWKKEIQQIRKTTNSYLRLSHCETRSIYGLHSPIIQSATFVKNLKRISKII